MADASWGEAMARLAAAQREWRLIHRIPIR
jgi:hypothetical protein